MSRKTLIASALAVLMAGSISLVMAQTTPPPASAATHAMPGKGMRPGMPMPRLGDRGGRGMPERSGVIGDLHGLEKLYMQAGRSKDLVPLYNDVLTKSQDPRVRDYVYQRLARLQAQPTNVDQAIATLRRGLDESLANEAKMHADQEKMRATWQQHHADAPPPPPAQ